MLGVSELFPAFLVERSISPVRVRTATIVGEINDMLGFDVATYLMASGTILAGAATPLIEHGNDPSLTDAVAVEDPELLPSGVNQEALATFYTSSDDQVRKLSYIGSLRFVRLTLFESTSWSGNDYSAICLKHRLPRPPAVQP